jgi:hypothetical protein
MDIHKWNGNDLITEILKLHPRGAEILRRYFDERYLQKGSLRILSLNIACILHGVSITKLIDDLDRAQADQGA